MRVALGYFFQIIGGLAAFALYVEICRYCQKKAYRRGYQQGRSDAEEWIVKLETDVDQARQEIWREER